LSLLLTVLVSTTVQQPFFGLTAGFANPKVHTVGAIIFTHSMTHPSLSKYQFIESFYILNREKYRISSNIRMSQQENFTPDLV